MKIIEYKGHFYNGLLWVRDKKNAMTFVSSVDAWEYIDDQLDPNEEAFVLHTI
jgi:hypothetical protein